MDGIDLQQILVDSVPAIISGVTIALIVYGLDERRAKRERQLSDFRIAANWEVSKPKPSMRNFHLYNVNLSGYDLSNANLESADLRKADLWATNLSEANLRGTNFKKAKFVGSLMKGAVAIRANFSNSVIRRHNYPDLDQKADFSKSIFIACRFRRAKIEEVIFRGANLSHADFSYAVVTESDFTGADLTDSKWMKVKRVEKCIWKNVKGISPENFPPELLVEIRRQNIK